MITSLIFIVPALIVLVNAKDEVYIGAIFHDGYEEAEQAFRYAVIRENMYNLKHELVPIIQKIDESDTYEAETVACSMLSEGVVAIFGPISTKTNGIVSSICNEFGIPHFAGHWRPQESVLTKPYHAYTRNLFPESTKFSRALADIIIDYDWKSFTIIYEDNNSLMRLQDILQIHNPEDSPVTVRQLGDESDYKPLLKEIYYSGESRILLDCSADKVVEILRQAAEVRLLEEYQSYVITSLNAHTIDFSGLEVIRSNITTFRIMDPTSVEIETAVHDWRQGEHRKPGFVNVQAEQVKIETALMHDTVRVFSAALREFTIFGELAPEKTECFGEATRWEQGAEILKIIDEKSVDGITGRITFDEQGDRNDFTLELLELTPSKAFKKIATWDAIHSINITRALSDVFTQISESLQNKTLIVASRLGMPFLRYKEKEEGVIYEGNNRFEGYSIDLIDAISKHIGFRYVFELVPDNKYGGYNKETKKWDGLVKHLLDRKADLAICDLTINYARRTAVDFTSPFMTLGISILFSKPKSEPPNLFSFMSPLSLNVWLHMATAYLCMTLILILLARMAADDWENPHPCEENPEELETIWNMANCIWLTVGSIMQQGCDILPKAASTRLALSMWFFFALIIISSYTANLAAFLTSSRMGASIENADDLAKQNKIKYGAVSGGSTMSFFKESNFSTFQRMWGSMESTEPSVFTKSNDEGEERVVKGDGKYAFLMESTAIEYIIQRNCNLTQIGGLLDSKGYGIAMPVNSPYRTHISQAVLKLQEEGKLQTLKSKWWIEKNVGESGRCTDDDTSSGDTPELGMDNVGGVFLVLMAGLSVAIFIGIIDFLWNIRTIAIEEKITPMQALRTELKFVLNLKIKTKPVGKGKESEEDSSSEKSSKSGQSASSQMTKNNMKLAGSFKHIDNI